MNICINGENVFAGLDLADHTKNDQTAVLVFGSKEQRDAFVEIVRQRDWEFRFGEKEG